MTNWSAGQSYAYQACDLGVGTIGDDVTLIVPRVNGPQSAGGFNPCTGMSSLQRQGNGWISAGTYSTIGSHYLAANQYQLGCSVCFLP